MFLHLFCLTQVGSTSGHIFLWLPLAPCLFSVSLSIPPTVSNESPPPFTGPEPHPAQSTSETSSTPSSRLEGSQDPNFFFLFPTSWGSPCLLKLLALYHIHALCLPRESPDPHGSRFSLAPAFPLLNNRSMVFMVSPWLTQVTAEVRVSRERTWTGECESAVCTLISWPPKLSAAGGTYGEGGSGAHLSKI